MYSYSLYIVLRVFLSISSKFEANNPFNKADNVYLLIPFNCGFQLMIMVDLIKMISKHRDIPKNE